MCFDWFVRFSGVSAGILGIGKWWFIWRPVMTDETAAKHTCAYVLSAMARSAHPTRLHFDGC